uniref:Uncharacterized protein n=1 Tax=Rhizophora mucronata TaxID=61149 RepID=A0A2P2LLD2_RHIMU
MSFVLSLETLTAADNDTVFVAVMDTVENDKKAKIRIDPFRSYCCPCLTTDTYTPVTPYLNLPTKRCTYPLSGIRMV